MGLKKRLVGNTQASCVIAHDKLAFWFFTNPDEKWPEGRKLKLVRDELSKVDVSLVSGDNFGALIWRSIVWISVVLVKATQSYSIQAF